MSDIRFRKMGLNDEVTITLPVHVLLGFLYGYAESDWHNICASQIAVKAQEAIVDPIYLNEQAAAQQEQIDRHNSIFHQVATMGIPGMPGMEAPPNVTDWLGSMPPPDDTPQTGDE